MAGPRPGLRPRDSQRALLQPAGRQFSAGHGLHLAGEGQLALSGYQPRRLCHTLSAHPGSRARYASTRGGVAGPGMEPARHRRHHAVRQRQRRLCGARHLCHQDCRARGHLEFRETASPPGPRAGLRLPLALSAAPRRRHGHHGRPHQGHRRDQRATDRGQRRLDVAVPLAQRRVPLLAERRLSERDAHGALQQRQWPAGDRGQPPGRGGRHGLHLERRRLSPHQSRHGQTGTGTLALTHIQPLRASAQPL